MILQDLSKHIHITQEYYPSGIKIMLWMHACISEKKKYAKFFCGNLDTSLSWYKIIQLTVFFK